MRPLRSITSNKIVFSPAAHQLSGALFQCSTSRVGLDTPTPSAGARGAVALDDHVADLGRPLHGRARACRRARSRRRFRCPRRPRAVTSRACRRRDEIRPRSPAPHRCPGRFGVPSACSSAAPSGNGSRQFGRLPAAATVPADASTAPGEPTPTPASAEVSTPAACAASRSAAAISVATSGGPPFVGCGPARVSLDGEAVTDHDSLHVRAPEVDATFHRIPFYLTAVTAQPVTPLG